MNKKPLTKLKKRLSKFIDDIDHVDPNDVSIRDIDEWIGLLDQLEEKVKQVGH